MEKTLFSGPVSKATRFTLVVDGPCSTRKIRKVLTMLSAHVECFSDEPPSGDLEYLSWFPAQWVAGQAPASMVTVCGTEQEYIDATNLAKVRAAKNVFRDFLPMTEPEEKEARAVFKALDRIETRLARVVKTKDA